MKHNHTTFDYGVVGYLEQDPDCDSPLEYDEAVKVAILHHHYRNPAPECGDNPDDLKAWGEANKDEWDAFPLFMYEHGNVCYEVACTEDGNPFSGRVGYVFVKKSDVPDTFNSAEIMCEEYTKWANGDCWGYIIENEDGEQLDSCWGFVGEDYAVAGMRAAAEGYVDGERERHDTEMADEIATSRPDLTPLEN